MHNNMHGTLVPISFLISGYFTPFFSLLKNDAKKNRHIEKDEKHGDSEVLLAHIVHVAEVLKQYES